VHGNIRPENIYWTGEKAVLGPIQMPEWTVPPKNWVYREEDHRADLQAVGFSFLSLLTGLSFDKVGRNPAVDISSDAQCFVDRCFSGLDESPAVTPEAERRIDSEWIPYFSNRALCKLSLSTRQTQKTAFLSPLGLGFAICPVNSDCILMTGGTGTPRSVYSLSLATLSPVPASDLLFPHYHHSMQLYNGQIWTVGGVNSPKCETYEESGWIEKANLHTCRERVSLTVHSDKLYAIGGADTLGESYTEATSWSLLSISYYVEGVFPWFTHSGRLLLVGGKTRQGYNERIQAVSLADGLITQLEASALGLFGVTPAQIVDTTVLIVSTAGKIAFLDPESISLLDF